MQNHPHDSICGCSVDEVHREMVPRFEKANEVGKYVAEEAVNAITAEINTETFAKDSFPFVVFNTNGLAKSGEAEIEVELERKTFAQGYPEQLYRALDEMPKGEYHVVDEQGQTVSAIVSEVNVRFDYDLPKDGFRIPYMKRYVTVKVAVKDLLAYSWETFALVAGAEANSSRNC
jgi:alpha-mannosidase